MKKESVKVDQRILNEFEMPWRRQGVSFEKKRPQEVERPWAHIHFQRIEFAKHVADTNLAVIFIKYVSLAQYRAKWSTDGFDWC